MAGQYVYHRLNMPAEFVYVSVTVCVRARARGMVGSRRASLSDEVLKTSAFACLFPLEMSRSYIKDAPRFTLSVSELHSNMSLLITSLRLQHVCVCTKKKAFFQPSCYLQNKYVGKRHADKNERYPHLTHFRPTFVRD